MLCITSLGQGSLTLQALWKEKFEQVPGLEKTKLRLSSYGFEIDYVISSHSVTCFFPQIGKLWPQVRQKLPNLIVKLIIIFKPVTC